MKLPIVGGPGALSFFPALLTVALEVHLQGCVAMFDPSGPLESALRSTQAPVSHSFQRLSYFFHPHPHPHSDCRSYLLKRNWHLPRLSLLSLLYTPPESLKLHSQLERLSHRVFQHYLHPPVSVNIVNTKTLKLCFWLRGSKWPTQRSPSSTL